MNEVGDVIDFLRENCDMIVKDEEEWWMTGITTQHFKKQLESAFNIKYLQINNVVKLKMRFEVRNEFVICLLVFLYFFS